MVSWRVLRFLQRRVRKQRRFIEREGDCVEKWSLERNYTFWAISSISFWYIAWEYRYRCECITFQTSFTQWYFRPLHSQNTPWEILVTVVAGLHPGWLRTRGLSLKGERDISRVFTSSGPTQPPIQKVVVGVALGSFPRK
jgi:hypothetical protein